MKKIAVFALIIAVCVFATSCSMLNNIVNTVNEAAKGTTKTDEEIYSALSSLVSNPTGSTTLEGTVTFVGYISSDPFEESFDDEDKVYKYQTVYIARNTDAPIYLDVTDIKEPLPAESYAKITGKVVGNVYWTVDNKRKEVLDFHAEKVESFTKSEAEPDTTNKLDLKSSSNSGTFKFVGAHHSKDSFKDVIVLYFNFTNNAPDTNVKLNQANNLLGAVDIYWGDVSTDRSSFDPDELDSRALKANDLQAYTYSGKTQLYYIVLKPEDADEVSHDDPLYIDLYNDEFAFTNSIEVPIAENLDAMNNAG